ncbi:hypothetical protein WKI65_29010 [Streptomyces sp. MS1.AVA.3]|uniref:hypothetical protein n=1 Tax=Streptomyces decoyicus TaxID=249567 RepID=UPI0030BEE2F0
MPFPWRMPLRGRRELSHVLVLLPIGLIVAVCVIDVLAPPDIHLGPLLVAAPAITAAFAGPRLTAAIGALAVAAQVSIGIARQVLFTENLQAQIASLVVVSGLVVLFTAVRERNERRLHTEPLGGHRRAAGPAPAAARPQWCPGDRLLLSGGRGGGGDGR